MDCFSCGVHNLVLAVRVKLLILPYADVNECNAVPSPCVQNCTNRNGSFSCDCNEGYSLNSDGINCDGMYLAQMVSDYVSICSFSLALSLAWRKSVQPYSLSGLCFSCIDINECLTAVLRGEQLCSSFLMCNNTIGSFECLCPPGTELTNNSCLGKLQTIMHAVSLGVLYRFV